LYFSHHINARALAQLKKCSHWHHQKGKPTVKGKPVIPPVYMTATYKFDNSDDLIDVVQNHSGYIYSRWDNPSVVEVENALANSGRLRPRPGIRLGHGRHHDCRFGPRACRRTHRDHPGDLRRHPFELMNTVLPGFGIDGHLCQLLENR
jgi:hypothetical protein